MYSIAARRRRRCGHQSGVGAHPQHTAAQARAGRLDVIAPGLGAPVDFAGGAFQQADSCPQEP